MVNRRNQNQGRNGTGKRNNRRAKHPSQVSRRADNMVTRTFRAVGRIFFQEEGPPGVGGVQGAFAYTAPISSYTGYEFIENNFEQYRVRSVEVLMKPSANALNNGAVPANVSEAFAYQNSVYSAMNSTYVQSFIDYDTGVNPTFTECQQRPTLKVNSLSPNNWTKIARFSPKTLSNQSASGTGPSNTFNSAVWMTTNNLGTELFGVRGVCSNTSPVFDTQDNVLCVDVRLAVVVEMKGTKNSNATSASVAVIGDPIISYPNSDAGDDESKSATF